MKAEIKNITPAIAEEILTRHNNRIAKGEFRQRAVSDKRVDQYALEMKRGHWVVNSSGIAFDENGDIVNGQHRLWAIVKSGVTVRTLWITELPVTNEVEDSKLTVNTIDTEDCGKPRLVSQQLQMDGVKSAFLIGAGLRVIAQICTYQSVKLNVNQSRELLDIYQSPMYRIMEATHTNTRILKGYILGTLAMYRIADATKADEFATEFHEMSGLGKGSPVTALINYFRNHATSGGALQFNAVKVVALACQHHFNGEKINALRSADQGVEWLCSTQKSKVTKVREVLGFVSV